MAPEKPWVSVTTNPLDLVTPDDKILKIPNFDRLIPDCVDTDCRNQRGVGKLLARSIRFRSFCSPPTKKLSIFLSEDRQPLCILQYQRSNAKHFPEQSGDLKLVERDQRPCDVMKSGGPGGGSENIVITLLLLLRFACQLFYPFFYVCPNSIDLTVLLPFGKL